MMSVADYVLTLFLYLLIAATHDKGTYVPQMGHGVKCITVRLVDADNNTHYVSSNTRERDT